jgi:two-component system, chemotaxis family, chemotaxis protein CheY
MALDTSVAVLVVDDSSTMIAIVQNLLRHIGFKDIDASEDAAAALTKMRSKRYGLVISDWNMAPMSGYDFLREVRSDAALKRTPFIVVTGEAKTEHVIAAKKAGVNNYIVKPFNAITLRNKIETALTARTVAASA